MTWLTRDRSLALLMAPAILVLCAPALPFDPFTANPLDYLAWCLTGTGAEPVGFSQVLGHCAWCWGAIAALTTGLWAVLKAPAPAKRT